MEGVMKALRLLAVTFVGVVLPTTVMATDLPPACKQVKYLGVSGCEILRDQTCPPGHHKQAVGPTNPQMKAPTRLMCVPDKPSPRNRHPKTPLKPNL
jgi:hypothetical protein